jgi:potassium/hydrogen antiporter
VIELAVAFLSFGLPALIDGSGLLGAYISGIVMGAGRMPHSGGVRRVHDSMAWLAQLSMFLLLGLLVTPSELVKAAVPGIAVALVLTFVVRPIAVLICLLPFRYPLRELGHRGSGTSGSGADHPRELADYVERSRSTTSCSSA